MAAQQVGLIQDVVDLVVEHLKDNRQVLINLSLVSHTWRISSRRWLFRDLQVNNWSSRRFDLRAFAELISSSTHVARSIRTLTLHGDDVPIWGKYLGIYFPSSASCPCWPSYGRGKQLPVISCASLLYEKLHGL